jgi:hypothetical protein
MARQPVPTPNPGPEWQSSEGPPTHCPPPIVQHVPPQAVRWPPLVGWPPGPTRRQSQDQVTDPCARSFKVRPPLLLLPEFNNQLVHNFHSKGVVGRAPERKFHSRGHRRLECGMLLNHLGVVEGSDPHPLRQVTPHSWRTDYNKVLVLDTPSYTPPTAS